jgi:hypothetical protein
MRNQETIKGIREQLKTITEAIAVIELKLSQLESESRAPAAHSLGNHPKPAIHNHLKNGQR